MEKSFTNRNSKKAIIVTDENLIIDGIKNILFETGYNATEKKLENINKRDFKSRLIIIISYDLKKKELELIKSIKENSFYANIILVTGVDRKVINRSIFRIGVDAVINAFDSKQILKKAIQIIEKDENYISPFYLKTAETDETDEKKLDNLTKRQYQIFVLTKDGKNKDEIAEILGIAPKTVGNHLSKIRNTIK